MTLRLKKPVSAALAGVLLTGLPPAAAEETGLPSGVWEQRGYSRVVEINKEGFRAWVIGSGFCYEIGTDVADFHRIRTPDGDTFAAYENGGVTEYLFDRIEAVPAACLAADDYWTSDPERNFDVLWKHFFENHKFFDLQGVDWLASYRKYRPRVTQETSNEDLYAIMTGMLSALKDGHVKLVPAQETGLAFWSAKRETTYATALRARAEARGAPAMAFPALNAAFQSEIGGHIKTVILNGEHDAALDDRLIWGALSETAGYLAIMDMDFGDDDASTTEQLDLLTKALDTRVLPFLDDFRELVIDVRFNSGGLDANALRLASRFGARSCLAFTKQTPSGHVHGMRQPVYAHDPNNSAARARPTAVLTSPRSSSATEIFIMAMRVQPNVRIVGERSEGILSDTWSGVLPNGWRFSLSNEIYTAADGALYEGVGVPVDVEAAVFKGPDILDNLAPSLERAAAVASQLTFDASDSCRHTTQ